MLSAAIESFFIIVEPFRLFILFLGVAAGLVLGIIPGIGGLTGMALLLPFTFSMDHYAAFAMLLGMAAVTGTSDTLPAVLLGVPGSSSAQATVMDGYPMAQRGEAGRALNAAYMASLLGGLVGAALLAVSIPVLTPIMLFIGSPELLALSIFGISMVVVLSGNAPLLGIAGAGFGIMLSMIGADPQTGTPRWTMDTLYLWEGLPLITAALGLFALPELADLAIRRSSVAAERKLDMGRGALRGILDALANWWLVVRCGALGAGIGAIPGIGSSVVDWFAYVHAKQTIKGADETFGRGDVRGVIAPESANNSITAGALVPTLAFGIPGSASMAILLGAFVMHGLTPGPEMLTTQLDVTYSMIWSVAIANILGAGICMLFSAPLARIANLSYAVLVPVVVIIIIIGAYQSSRQWADIYSLLFFALIGWTMKRLKWPRPTLLLGFVLGDIIERYLFISNSIYGSGWVLRPVVVVLLTIAVLVFVGPIYKDFRRRRGLTKVGAIPRKITFHPSDLFYLFFIGLVGIMMYQSLAWHIAAKFVPLAVGSLTLAVAVASLAYRVFNRARATEEAKSGPMAMDLGSSDGLSASTVIARAGLFLAYVLGFLTSIALFGLMPSIPLFTVLFMRREGQVPWLTTLAITAGFMLSVYVLFDLVMNVPWPESLIGHYVPALRVIPSI